MNFKTVKTVLLAVVGAVSGTVSAQDLIAVQAPTDKLMKAVDSVSLQRLLRADDAFDFDMDDLYPEWDNNNVHGVYGKTQLPDTFRINLRNFCMPTDSRKVTSNYGYRASFRRMHKGIDVKVYTSDTIRAAFDGKVRVSSYNGGGYGNFVVIRHNNGLETIYGHLSRRFVNPNQTVKAGQPIGMGGNTGRSTGSHLHFETRFMGVAINPALMFDFANQDVTADSYVFRRKGNSYSMPSSTLVARTAYAESKRPVSDGSRTSRYHKVRKGDTIYSIARANGTSVSQLCKANRLSKRSKLRPGQIIRLK